VYRAVHLEIVTSCSTDYFLLAFHHFICRRGRPSTVSTDNGTNFEGANNFFKSIDWKKVMLTFETVPIHWKFNPPSAPWWGGFWERLIREVKKLLKRTLGNRKLTLTQIENLLFEIEAVLNSRPLTYIGADDAFEPSAAHFLTEIPNNSLPELDIITPE